MAPTAANPLPGDLMHPYLMSLIAQERQAQLMAEAEQSRLAAVARDPRTSMWSRLVRLIRWGRRPSPTPPLTPRSPEVVIDLTAAGSPSGGAVGADDHAGACHLG